jgi:hypothetical protein
LTSLIFLFFSSTFNDLKEQFRKMYFGKCSDFVKWHCWFVISTNKGEGSMKKIFYMLAVVMGLMAFSVQAEEVAKPAEANAPVVRISVMEYGGSDEKYSPKDFPNGVIVLAGKRPLFSKPVYSELVDQMLEQNLQKRGFKIANNQETADVAFYVVSTTIDFSEIDKGQNDNLKRGLSIADDIAGIVLGAKLSGNQTVLTNGVNINLHKSKHTLGVVAERKGVKDVASRIAIESAVSEDTPKVSEMLVELMFDEWAKVHIVESEPNNEPKNLK